MRLTPSRCARQNCQEMTKHNLAQIPCMCIYWAERGRRLRCSTWRARNKTFAKIRIVWNYPQKGFFAKLTAEERKKSLPTQMWNKALKKSCHSIHSKWWSVLRRNVESAAEALAAVRPPEKDSICRRAPTWKGPLTWGKMWGWPRIDYIFSTLPSFLHCQYRDYPHFEDILSPWRYFPQCEQYFEFLIWMMCSIIDDAACDL